MSGAFGAGGTTNPAMSSYAYQPQNQGAADQGWGNVFSSLLGNFQGLQNSPYAQQQMGAAANVWGPYLENLGSNQAIQFSQLQGLPTGVSALASGMTQGIQPLQQGAQNLLTAGYDPQQALFNQLTNQATQQSNAANAAAGVAGPYAAANTGKPTGRPATWQPGLQTSMACCRGW